LTVLSVAYPFARTGRDAVGGAEQVLSQLDEALVRRGHRSLVVACAGSTVAGTLVSTPVPDGPITDALRKKVIAAHHARILEALDRYDVDVVHLHGVDFYEYLPPEGVPTLVTLHLPPSWYPPHVFQLRRAGLHLHCVSAAQRRTCPPGAALLEDVPNGVSVDELWVDVPKDDYALVLSRICPEKNLAAALDAGRRAGVPVILGGQVFPYAEHERYFREEIAPRLDAQIRFIGPVGWAAKRRLLSAAKCLLQPSLAPETSSLVAMEAIACGTPVIAFPSGALPEIIEPGRTGWIVRDEHEMAQAIGWASAIDPVECRGVARRRFSVEATIERYLSLYERLAYADTEVLRAVTS
jgi:glycosyltransferase involved in cell wall biosynthesis